MLTLDFRRVTKTFGSIRALDDVSFSINAGEIFGLVGPNGSGKTTLLKLCCGLLMVDGGEMKVLNLDPWHESTAIKMQVGFALSEERSLYWRLTGRQNLEFFGSLYRIGNADLNKRIGILSENLDLHSELPKQVGKMSSGNRHRLLIARALIHSPKLLLLDEPTRSLDPIARENMHTLIKRLQADQNLTIVMASHDLAETAFLCSRVGVLKKGKLVRIVAGNSHLARGYKIEIDRPSAYLQTRKFPMESADGCYEFSFYPNPELSLHDLLKTLLDEGVKVLRIGPLQSELRKSLDHD